MEDNPAQIVEQYLNGLMIIKKIKSQYPDTMWKTNICEAIAEGIKSVDKDATVKLFNAGKTDKNNIITELFKSKAILFGSSTVNKSIMHATAGLLSMIRGIGFKNKKGAAFGSYGWSGESIGMLEEELKAAKIEVVQEGIKALWDPDEEAKKQALNSKGLCEKINRHIDITQRNAR